MTTLDKHTAKNTDWRTETDDVIACTDLIEKRGLQNAFNAFCDGITVHALAFDDVLLWHPDPDVRREALQNSHLFHRAMDAMRKAYGEVFPDS